MSMLLARIEETRRHLKEFVRHYFEVELGPLQVEKPPRMEFGDLAFPFPFELAKVLRRPPRSIATEIVENIPPLEGIERFVAAGGGYVNLFFVRATCLTELYSWTGNPIPTPQTGKKIVEHTNINPNKAAHIGHFRNAALGDTLVRLLRACGHSVEVQNYIDNTGVQVADVVVGFRHLRDLSLDAIQHLPEPFDFYCWDLYAEVSAWYQKNEERLQLREQTLKEIEDGREPTSAMAEAISMRIVLAHLKTMLRIGVRYQVLPRESEILQLDFWAEAFERLRETGAITLRDEGPYKGCWTMLLSGNGQEAEEEKIIVRSNGTVTYVGKDIAYQLWKFGLLDKQFCYRPMYQYANHQQIGPGGGEPNEDTVWLTTSQASSNQTPNFGKADTVYNVIDVRQSYLQRVVAEGLRRLGHTEQAERSIHFSYEMVALSPACCQELGIDLTDQERSKPYVEVSGRKGLGVKADDLFDKLLENSLREVESRNPNLTQPERAEIARRIAAGALRYFLLKYTRTSVIAFDFGEALAFEGETGPYLQYTVVRANNIFKKLAEQDPSRHTHLGEGVDRLWDRPEVVSGLLDRSEIWSVLLGAARLDEVVEQAVRTLEISTLAKHLFNMAQQFNVFYHSQHILSEQDEAKQSLYLTVAEISRRSLVRGLDLLGIEIPEKM